MKTIKRLGPLTVIHNGSHFELPAQHPICHGLSNLCECASCKARLAKPARVALPWEDDYREAA